MEEIVEITQIRSKLSMPNIRYLKYSFTDKETDEHFSVDFSQALDVKERHLDLVVKDLSDFKIDRDMIGAAFTSVLELAVDEGILKIAKNYETDSLTLDPPSETDPYVWLNNKLSSEQSLSAESFSKFVIHYSDDIQRLKDRVADIYKQMQQQPEDTSDYRKQIVELGGEDAQKYLETLDKIDEAETTLNSQSKTEELKAELDSKRKQIEEIDQKLESVNGIIEQQRKISESLQRFAPMLSRDINQEAQQFKQEIELYRQNQLQRLSEEQKSDSDAKRKVISRGVKSSSVSNFTSVLGVLVIAFGIGAALFTSQWNLALAGITFGTISLIIWFRARILPRDITVNSVGAQQIELASSSEQNQSKDLGTPGRIRSVEKFFVDKAWLMSLRQEMHRLQEKVREDLGGKDVSVFVQQKQDVVAEGDKIQKQLTQLEGQELSPEDYLKKRRELDMLKVDKARSESKLRKSENFKQILELTGKMKGDGDAKADNSGVAIDIIDGYDRVKLEGNQVMLHTSEGGWVNQELTLSQMYGLLLYSRFKQWEASPLVPFVLVNVLHHLDEDMKDFVNARINELGDSGQVILVNLAL